MGNAFCDLLPVVVARATDADRASGQLDTGGWVMWILLMLLGFAGSAMYSGIETGAYSLNRVRLHLLAQQDNPPARTLERLLHKPTTLLGTLLIGNNVSNYLGTFSLSILLGAMGYGELAVIVLNTVLITPILFVFGETLPKDLFAAHADRLMYHLTPVLTWTRAVSVATGLLPAIGLFTEVVMRTLGQGGRVNPFHPRRQVEVLVKEGVGYGLLSEEQSAIVQRVLALTDTRVQDEMIPWQRVVSVKQSDDAEMLWQLADRSAHRRFPVLDEAGRVVGVVSCIEAMLHTRGEAPPIEELMREPLWVSPDTPLRDALTRLQQSRAALAIVGDGETPRGVVTIKDLIEPITGELVRW
ncbi:MAG: CNNM domain-containing protein [Phycisphaeraceae bacterium]